MDKYINAIRKRVCTICADSDEDGFCTLTDNEKCAVEIFLPRIISVVHESANRENMDLLYKELKEKVCTECKTRMVNGNCYLRKDSNCSLDRYFSLIVDTIQRVDAGLAF
ncbi:MULTISPECIES: hypothetical protein [Melioribacter]|uniref:hypothetical protein n=1 Tax=Melioribacter TaxID=1134403 RepID=UPI000305B696|nr:hypothetical protein [Melioribacter roseus]